MSTPAPKRPKSRIGRIIVFSVYGAICLYGIAAIGSSMIRDLYGAPPAQPASAAEHAWCVRRLAGLKTDLSSRVTNELRHDPRRTAPLDNWEKWDQRYVAQLESAYERCATGRDSSLTIAFSRLRELHTTYSQAVHQVIRARTEIATEIDAELTKLELR